MTTIASATTELFARLRPEGADDFDADFVVAPTSVEEAATVIGHAADHGISVGIRGGGTHQGLGERFNPDLMVTTSAMAGIIDYQPEDLTIVVQGGLPVTAMDELLAERGQTAVLPEQPGAATVGGVVAAAASGYRRTRYGPTRDRVLQVSMATGYGQVVTAGGRVVKNSTGYDLARLCVGSLGALGLIGSVCLKLWPNPVRTATVQVEDAVTAAQAVYRPLAVVEADGRGFVYLGGTAEEVDAQARLLGAEAADGLHWPESLQKATRLSLRVPPRVESEALERLLSWTVPVLYRRQVGVGEIEVGCDEAIDADLGATRRWAESQGGALVLLAGAAELYERFGAWGSPPPSLEIQRRVKAAFDPAGVLNPGRLPGGL